MTYLSLKELNQMVKEALSAHMEPSYWVVAEIGEMRLTQKGHCYLELVEKDERSLLAKSRATIWSYQYRRLSGWFEALTGEPLRAGMKILAEVEVGFHEVYGMSFNIRDIDANFTLGERARRKQEVLAQLSDEGVLEMNKSLPLPTVPQTVAVISSPTAAGLGDFMDQMQANRYGYHFNVRLFKAMMQGDQASASITEAMLQVYEYSERQSTPFDLLVIIRGGGAQVDLDCFDSYELASHIAQFPLPVITGIGHERDETVADLVAHTRMKTPTAVAEFLINGMCDYEEKISRLWSRISQAGQSMVKNQSYELERQVQQLRFRVFEKLRAEYEQLEIWQRQVKSDSQRKIKENHAHLEMCYRKVQKSSMKNLERQGERFTQIEKFVKASDPQKILQKGFTYTRINGVPIHQVHNLKAGDEVQTYSNRFKLISTLNKREQNEEKKN